MQQPPSVAAKAAMRAGLLLLKADQCSQRATKVALHVVDSTEHLGARFAAATWPSVARCPCVSLRRPPRRCKHGFNALTLSGAEIAVLP